MGQRNKENISEQMLQLRTNMENVLDSFKIYVEEDPKTSTKKNKILDFILVFSTADKHKEGQGEKFSSKMASIDEYLKNLRGNGFEIELVAATFDKHLVFVKLYGAKNTLKNFAGIYDINLMCNNLRYSTDNNRFFKRFACEVNNVRPGDPLFARAPETLSNHRPKDVTVAERIMITYQILRVTSFGAHQSEQGIVKLLRKKIFLAAYPLHDEALYWTDEGLLSDRQLLYRFWASPGQFWKKQPLNLVEKYFGTEIAFYFSFLAYYAFLLTPVALIGTLCFTNSLIAMWTPLNVASKEICQSNLTMCPPCEYFKSCKYEDLKTNCINANVAYLLDNRATVTFSVLISLWATVFMELWKRQQAKLAFRWNVLSVALDTSFRPEFEIQTTLKRISSATGDWEPYELRRKKYARLCVSYACVFFLILIALVLVIAVNIYYNMLLMSMRLSSSLFVRKYATIFASSTASTISVVCIISFQQLYLIIVRKLTDLENLRTQKEYSNSYIYKAFIVCFINGYSVAFYIAFFKGRFYTYPNDPNRSDKTYVSTELCTPVGCTVNLFIHLVIVLVVKSVFFNVLQVMKPVLLTYLRRLIFIRRKKQHRPIWEEQYMLESVDEFFLVPEYQEIALQYGFVTFFTAAFPLAPLLALCHAVASIRVDSFKMITSYRRLIPVRVNGLQAWEGIFRVTTHIGTIVNAFIIAFTLDFIPRQIMEMRSHKTFIESILSEFDTQDYAERGDETHPSKCYYRGLRYPPGHANKYKHTVDFWLELAIRLVFVIVFEHLILAAGGILAYVIPDAPRSIKEKLNRERAELVKRKLVDKTLAADDDVQRYAL